MNGAPKHLRHHCTLLLGGLSMEDRTFSCSVLSCLYASWYSRLKASLEEKQSRDSSKVNLTRKSLGPVFYPKIKNRK